MATPPRPPAPPTPPKPPGFAGSRTQWKRHYRDTLKKDTVKTAAQQADSGREFGGRPVLLSPRRARLLAQLLDALEPAIPHMRDMRVGIFGLRDTAGNNRLLKLLTAEKEASEAEDLGQGGGEGGGGGDPAPDVKPFDVTVSLDEEAVDPETADRIVTLQPGVVNNLLPTNMFSEFAAPASGVRYVVLAVTTADGEVTGATLSIASSAPDPIPVELSTPPIALALLIAVIIDGVAHQIIRGNISLTSREAFRVDRDSPAAPGELPFLSYWTWEQG